MLVVAISVYAITPLVHAPYGSEQLSVREVDDSPATAVNTFRTVVVDDVLK